MVMGTVTRLIPLMLARQKCVFVSPVQSVWLQVSSLYGGGGGVGGVPALEELCSRVTFCSSLRCVVKAGKINTIIFLSQQMIAQPKRHITLFTGWVEALSEKTLSLKGLWCEGTEPLAAYSVIWPSAWTDHPNIMTLDMTEGTCWQHSSGSARRQGGLCLHVTNVLKLLNFSQCSQICMCFGFKSLISACVNCYVTDK